MIALKLSKSEKVQNWHI